MGKYIDKIEFHNLLKEYRDINVILDDDEEVETEIEYSEEELSAMKLRSDKVYEKIGKRFLLIARNYINKPLYINYSDDWKDDMISEAVYDMVRYIHNYNIELMDEYLAKNKTPDPFAYFSQYAYHGVMRFLGEKKKDKDVLVRLPFIENIDKRDISHE